MKKKILYAGLAALTAVSVFGTALGSTGVSAETTAAETAAAAEKTGTDTSDAVKDAVKMVRSRIDIPKECTVFESSVNEYDGKTTYDLYWRAKEGGKSANVSVSDGMITSCYIYTGSYSSNAGISPYTDAQLEAMAKRLVNRIAPEAAGKYKLKEISSDLSSGNATVTFVRVCRDIPVRQNTISVSINKYNGELSDYYCSWYGDAAFVDPSKALSQEDIKKKYAADVKAVPQYVIQKDKSGKKAVPVYTTSDDVLYDALTGQKSPMKDDFKVFMNTDTYYDNSAYASAYGKGGMGGGEEGGEYQLTEEEMKNAEELSGMLSSAEFRKIAEKDPYMGITERYHLESFSISRSYDDSSKYIIYAGFKIDNGDDYKYVSVNADAVTGKIYYFYRYDNNYNYGGTPDITEANSLGRDVLKYYLGSNADHFKADKSNTDTLKTEYDSSSRSLTYHRYENNILVQGEDVNITVNSQNIVTSFNYTFTEGVDFGDGRIITADRAMERLLEQQDLSLEYQGFLDLKSKSHIYLTYSMDEWYINAVTGMLCTSDGREKTAADKTCPYTDIEDSPYKDEIIALYTYGVDITGTDTLDPKKPITQDEFSDILSKVNSWNPIVYSDKTKGTDGNNAGKVYSIDVAAGFVCAAGMDNAAKLKGIYNVPVKNVSADDKRYGTVAVGYALGVVDEDFDPEHLVTREEALHSLYGYTKAAADRA
ncbi:MAG: S-layer homology domain-containing protein [Oscillospiraceae bacterium]|nr:S-layer homology domain-containing protein [Oscillospiraceae bacterium]